MIHWGHVVFHTGTVTDRVAPEAPANLVRSKPPATAFALGKNERSDQIRHYGDDDDFGGEGKAALHVNDRENREHDIKQGHEEAGRGGQA